MPPPPDQPAPPAPPRPRVLFIGSGAVWRGGSGHLVRQAMFLDALTRAESDVTAAMFHLEDEKLDHAPEGLRRVIALPTPDPPRPGRLKRYLHDRFNPLPRRLLRDLQPGRRVMRDLRVDHEFDCVFAYRIDFAHWAGVLDHPRLLLDVDDPEFLRDRRMYERDPERLDPRTARDLDKLERFERAAVRGVIRRGGAAFVCQAGDRDAFDEPRPRVAPNTVRVSETPPPREEVSAGRPTLLFVGNCAAGRVGANGDGLGWFLEEVWPRVRGRLSGGAGAELRIVGKLSDELGRLAQREGATPLGFVPDVGEEMRRATASIAPIRFGTGTRIKILDAFARGCPVVSTRMGADGLHAVDGEHLLLADDVATFADRCVAVLSDPALARRVGEGGWRLARERFSRDRIVPELAATLRSLIDDLSQRRGSSAAGGG